MIYPEKLKFRPITHYENLTKYGNLDFDNSIDLTSQVAEGFTYTPSADGYISFGARYGTNAIIILEQSGSNTAYLASATPTSTGNAFASIFAKSGHTYKFTFQSGAIALTTTFYPFK